jgi:hypothetical protein
MIVDQEIRVGEPDIAPWGEGGAADPNWKEIP